MSESSVTVVIAYRALPGRADEAVKALAALIATVVATEPDCFWIRLYQDPADRARILLYELWTSQEAYLGPHFQTPHIQAFIKNAGDFLTGPPEISFWELRAEELSSTSR